MSRYSELRDLARQELHLTTNDVGDTLAETLFNKALKIYSRFRGKRKTTTLTLVADQADYEIGSSVAHIIGVYWNDTYPSEYADTVKSDVIQAEEYHNPTLKVIDDLKKRLEAAHKDYDKQEWCDYDDSGTHKIYLDPVPETNIIVEYRELFTKDNFPRNDEDLLTEMLKWKMVEYIIGIPQVRSQGDVTYDTAAMTKKEERLRRNIFSTLQTVKVGRT